MLAASESQRGGRLAGTIGMTLQHSAFGPIIPTLEPDFRDM